MIINLSIPSISIKPDEVVDFLKKNIQFKDISEQVLHQRVINQAAQDRGIVVTSEEVQAEADRIRHEKRLERASDTLAWLNDQMIAPDDWEAGIGEQLLAKKLAEFLFSKEVEKFFAQNRLDFDQVLLYQITVPDGKLAQELFYQLEEREISFYEAAHLYDIDQKRRNYCGCEGAIDRWKLKPEIAALVFGAKLGEVIKPVKTEQGYHLFMVEEFIPAELTSQRYQEIMDSLFKQWLESELNYMLHSQ